MQLNEENLPVILDLPPGTNTHLGSLAGYDFNVSLNASAGPALLADIVSILIGVAGVVVGLATGVGLGDTAPLIQQVIVPDILSAIVQNLEKLGASASLGSLFMDNPFALASTLQKFVQDELWSILTDAFQLVIPAILVGVAHVLTSQGQVALAAKLLAYEKGFVASVPGLFTKFTVLLTIADVLDDIAIIAVIIAQGILWTEFAITKTVAAAPIRVPERGMDPRTFGNDLPAPRWLVGATATRRDRPIGGVVFWLGR